MQRNLYSNLPLKFMFPYKQFIVIILTSVTWGILSTVFPTCVIMRNSIAQIAKM